MDAESEVIAQYRADPTAFRQQLERAARRNRTENLRRAFAFLRRSFSRILVHARGMAVAGAGSLQRKTI